MSYQAGMEKIPLYHTDGKWGLSTIHLLSDICYEWGRKGQREREEHKFNLKSLAWRIL